MNSRGGGGRKKHIFKRKKKAVFDACRLHAAVSTPVSEDLQRKAFGSAAKYGGEREEETLPPSRPFDAILGRKAAVGVQGPAIEAGARDLCERFANAKPDEDL